jgi:hypothetical protein
VVEQLLSADLPALLQSREITLVAANKSPTTITCYARGANLYLRWCEESGHPIEITWARCSSTRSSSTPSARKPTNSARRRAKKGSSALLSSSYPRRVTIPIAELDRLPLGTDLGTLECYKTVTIVERDPLAHNPPCRLPSARNFRGPSERAPGNGGFADHGTPPSLLRLLSVMNPARESPK